MRNHVVEAEELFGCQYRMNGSQTQLIFPCPKCHEGQKEWKLYVGIESGGFKCQRCEYRGFVYVPFSVREKALGARLPPMQMSEIYGVAVQPGSPAWKYLTETRKLTPDQIRVYQMSVSPLRDWMGAVLMPTLDESYRGFQARIYDNTASRRWKHASQRYYNSPGFRRVETVFNFQRAREARILKICEGPFSAIAAGLDAVATYGKDVSLEQFERIISAKAEEFVVCYDGDEEAREKRSFLASMLYSYGKKVSVVLLPDGQDPDSVENFQSYFDARVPVDEYWLMREKLSMVSGNSLWRNVG